MREVLQLLGERELEVVAGGPLVVGERLHQVGRVVAHVAEVHVVVAGA
jgi:hypothetical protein